MTIRSANAIALFAVNNKAGPEGLIGFELLVVGAVAITIATFLPLTEATGVFSTVQSNTMIQSGGWWFLLLAAGIAGTGYQVCFQKPTNYAWPIINCFLAAGYTAVLASDKESRTLYPVGPNGGPDTSGPGELTDFGIAIYVAGVGVAAALLGSLVRAYSAYRAVHNPDGVAAGAVPANVFDQLMAQRPINKKCPDCAETILTAAKVCKHCGYRFPPARPIPRRSYMLGSTTSVSPHPVAAGAAATFHNGTVTVSPASRASSKVPRAAHLPDRAAKLWVKTTFLDPRGLRRRADATLRLPPLVPADRPRTQPAALY